MADKDFDYGLPPAGVFGTDPELHLRGDVWYSYEIAGNGVMQTEPYTCWLSYKACGDSSTVGNITRLYQADTWEQAVVEGARLLRKVKGEKRNTS